MAAYIATVVAMYGKRTTQIYLVGASAGMPISRTDALQRPCWIRHNFGGYLLRLLLVIVAEVAGGYVWWLSEFRTESLPGFVTYLIVVLILISIPVFAAAGSLVLAYRRYCLPLGMIAAVMFDLWRSDTSSLLAGLV